MKETLNEFFSPISRRIANPLISSFVISWIITNWRIVISCFNSEEIKFLGHVSIIRLVESQSQTSIFWYPFFGALVYTFIFPFIRIGTSAIHEYCKKIGSNLNFRISKDGSIPVGQYLKYVKNYDELQLQLEGVIRKEGQYREESERLYNENLQVREEIEGLKKSHRDAKEELLRGEWYIEMKGKLPEKFLVLIKDHEIFQLDGITRNKILIATIVKYISHPKVGDFVLRLKPRGDSNFKLPNTLFLYFNNSLNKLKGEDNENNVIEMFRKDDIERQDIYYLEGLNFPLYNGASLS